MQITADNWQLLSPLLDYALLLAPTERLAWLAQQTQLSTGNQAHLARLVLLANAPETDHVFEQLNEINFTPIPHYNAALGAQSGERVGPYQLLRLLGRGGMAEVWLARRSDGAYEREVALKLPLAHLPQNMATVRLLRERNVLAVLEHPSIARLYDAGVAANGQPYLAMESVEGESILSYANRLKLDLKARARLMSEVLAALHYAHQHLVVHRDLKPSNIVVRSDGRVVLLDFGIAKVLASATSSSQATELTHAVGAALTLAYAAPEQLLAEPVTTASDLYSAGVVLFELLTGVRPFAQAERSPSSLLQAIETLPVPLKISGSNDSDAARHGFDTASDWQRAFAGDLAAICARAMRPEPLARYPSALSMREDLARYFDDQPVHARAGAGWYRTQKFFARNRTAVVVSGVALVSAISFATHAWQKTRDSQASAARAMAIESVVKNLFDGMNPNGNTPRNFTAKELLDRSRPLLLQAGATDVDARSKTNLMMGKLYLDIGAFDEAISLFNTEIAAARGSGNIRGRVWAQCLLSDAYLDIHKSQLAYDTMTDARSSLAQLGDPVGRLSAEVEYRLGTAALFLQQSDEAEQRLRDARGMLHTSGETAVELLANIIVRQATIVRGRGDLIAASRYFSEAQKLLINTVGMQLSKDALAIEMLPVSVALGQFAEALAQAEPLLAQFATRLNPDNPYPLIAANHYAAALMRLGRLGEAKTQVEWVKNNASAGQSGMLLFSRILDAQISLYSGDAAAAESRFVALLTEDARAPNVTTQSLLKRHLAHGLLQQQKNVEALTLLKDIEATQVKTIRDSASADIAFTRLLLGVALMRLGDLSSAQATLTAARDVLREKRGATHYSLLLAESYLALISAATGRLVTDAASLGERVQQELAWQHGGPDLANQLKKLTTGTPQNQNRSQSQSRSQSKSQSQTPATRVTSVTTPLFVPALL